MRNLHNLIQVICEFESKFHTNTRVETPHNMLGGGGGGGGEETLNEREFRHYLSI